MTWRVFERSGRRTALTLLITVCCVADCGDGTAPVRLDPLVGALQVSAASPSGWAFLDEGSGGAVSEGWYVTGPGTAPLGFGSARLYVSGPGAGVVLGTQLHGATRFDEITGLQYSSYVALGSAVPVAASLQFNVDYDLTDGDAVWQGRLVYEPYFSGPVTQGTWQTFTPQTGRWWATGGAGAVTCPQSSPCTWAEVLAAFPDAGIQAGGLSGLLFKAGSGWNESTVYVDAFTITAAGVTETYDFEPSLEPCAFEPSEASRLVRLTADCTTDHTLFIPNGWTVDGAGHTITAVDPASGGFLGAVLRNGGARAHARNLHVIGNVGGGCHADDERLRGILFEGASGTILFNRVENILRVPAYGCQEGNGIEVRNAPFDGTHPNTQQVVVQHNTVLRYQKTGILANGDVRVVITNNEVSSAAKANDENLDDYIAANSIQVGFGVANATVHANRLQGNDWDGAGSWSATAILIYYAGDVEITNNEIGGGGPAPLDEQTDIGIYAEGSGFINVMGNYVGRHDEDESGRPCESRGCDPDGVGIYFYENDGMSKAVSNRFSGNWLELQVGADLAKANRVVPMP